MKISRNNQQVLADIVLRVLARGLCSVSMFDKRVSADIKALGDGFSFSVCAGLFDNAPCIRLKTENGRFARANTDESVPDVVIRFKDISGVLPVLSGKISVATAFAQHRMLVYGSLRHAVALVRIINITEAYLFPKFILRHAMSRVPKKQVPSLFVYITLFFFGMKKPPSVNAPAAAEIVEDAKIVEGIEAAEDGKIIDVSDGEIVESDEVVENREVVESDKLVSDSDFVEDDEIIETGEIFEDSEVAEDFETVETGEDTASSKSLPSPKLILSQVMSRLPKKQLTDFFTRITQFFSKLFSNMKKPQSVDDSIASEDGDDVLDSEIVSGSVIILDGKDSEIFVGCDVGEDTTPAEDLSSTEENEATDRLGATK